jgi:hypothetical protein
MNDRLHHFERTAHDPQSPAAFLRALTLARREGEGALLALLARAQGVDLDGLPPALQDELYAHAAALPAFWVALLAGPQERRRREQLFARVLGLGVTHADGAAFREAPSPAHGEPDTLAWTPPGMSHTLVLLRHLKRGHWCGYATIVEPRVDISDLFPDGISDLFPDGPWAHDVHGGVTFNRTLGAVDIRPTRAAYLAERGVTAETRAVGFDCAHWSDAAPLDAAAPSGSTWRRAEGLRYRTAAFALNEAYQLARLLDGLPRSD